MKIILSDAVAKGFVVDSKRLKNKKRK